MKKNIERFVRDILSQIDHFDANNVEHLKEVVRKSLLYYDLQSYEEVERTDQGIVEYLYIHSIAEENFLTNVVKHSINDEKEISIEEVYHGYVVRRH